MMKFLRYALITPLMLLALTRVVADEPLSEHRFNRASHQQNNQTRLEIVLDNKQLKNNIIATLQNYNADTIPLDQNKREHYYRLVHNLSDQALRALGYYNSEMSIKDNYLYVKLQDPVRIKEAKINLFGSGQDDQEIRNFIDHKRAQPNEIVNHQHYDDFKGGLLQMLLDRGYFDAEFTKAQLQIIPRKHRAYWDIAIDTRERYSLGELRINSSRLNNELIANIINLKHDSWYHIEKMQQISERIGRSGYFQNIFVEPQVDRENKKIAISATLIPRKKHQLRASVGYNSSTGIHAGGSWSLPYINQYGHKFSSNIKVTSAQVSTGIQYVWPLLGDPLNEVYSLDANASFMRGKDGRNFADTALSLLLSRYFRRDQPLSFSVSLLGEFMSSPQLNKSNYSFYYYPQASVNFIKSDGKLYPLNGLSVQAHGTFSHRFLGSQINLAHFTLEGSFIKTFANKHRLVNRTKIGYLLTDNLEKIPLNFRFFAGGYENLRGYPYRSIGREDNRNGGDFLFASSGEYQYNFATNWWGTVFVDTALVTHQFKAAPLKVGIGAGLRWISPIGAIRFDIATPAFDTVNKSIPFEIYLGFGSEL